MSQPLDFVQPGEPFRPTAAAWNSFVETARDVRAKRVIFGVPDLAGDAGEEGLTPYIITQTKTVDEETFPVAVFRDVNEEWERRYISQETRAQTFEAQRAIWDGTDEEFNFPPGDPVTVDIYTHLMSGVAFTGQRIVVSNVGGKLCCVGGSSGHLFLGETAEAIAADASGLVELVTIDSTRATVYALNDTNADLADETNITVEFHDGRQVFIISRRAC